MWEIWCSSQCQEWQKISDKSVHVQSILTKVFEIYISFLTVISSFSFELWYWMGIFFGLFALSHKTLSIFTFSFAVIRFIAINLLSLTAYFWEIDQSVSDFFTTWKPILDLDFFSFRFRACFTNPKNSGKLIFKNPYRQLNSLHPRGCSPQLRPGAVWAGVR